MGCDNLAQGKTAKLSPPWVAGPTTNSTLKGCDTGWPRIVAPLQGANSFQLTTQGGAFGLPWAMLSQPFRLKTKTLTADIGEAKR